MLSASYSFLFMISCMIPLSLFHERCRALLLPSKGAGEGEGELLWAVDADGRLPVECVARGGLAALAEDVAGKWGY